MQSYTEKEVWLNNIVVSLDTGFLSLKLKDNTQVFCFMAGVSVLDTVRALNEEQFIKQGVERGGGVFTVIEVLYKRTQGYLCFHL